MHMLVHEPTHHPTVPRLLAHTTALPPTAVTAVFAIAGFLVPVRTATGGSVRNTERSGGDVVGGGGRRGVGEEGGLLFTNQNIVDGPSPDIQSETNRGDTLFAKDSN
jgi:hypothetical protein